MAATRSSAFVALDPLARAAFFGVIALAVCIIGVVNLAQGRSDLIAIYIAFVAYVLTICLPLAFYKPDWGIFHPLVFGALWWGLARDVLPRVGLYANGMTFHYALPGWSSYALNELVADGLLLHVLALLSMYAGYLAVRKFSTPVIEFPAPRLLTTKVLCVATLCTAAFGLLLLEAGGIGGLLLQRGLPSDQRIGAETGRHWQFIVGLLPTACLLWYALKPQALVRPVFWAVAAGALFMDFASSGSRAGLIVPILIGLSIWSLHRRRIPYVTTAIAALLSLAAIGLLGQFRQESRGASDIAEVQVEAGATGGIEEGADNVSSYAVEIAGLYGVLGQVPRPVDHLWGRSYLAIPAAPIPRALWRGKPYAIGKHYATRILHNPLTSVSPGNVGEAFWNFHVPGVVLVFFVWGLVLRWIACLYLHNQGSKAALALFALTLFTLQPNSATFYQWLQLMIATVLMLCFFCGLPYRGRSTTAAAQAA